MVRLKVDSEKVYTLVKKEFQFLMVRLKENVFILGHIICNISIPYGAIKRFY